MFSWQLSRKNKTLILLALSIAILIALFGAIRSTKQKSFVDGQANGRLDACERICDGEARWVSTGCACVVLEEIDTK